MTAKADQASTRVEVQGRLDAITARIQTRAGEIGDIEARQLAAATAGDAPDPTLATAKAALLDAQSIDERAAAAVRGQLDQIAAAAKRAADLARLAQLRAESAQKGREAEEEADGFPAAVEAAVEALRVAAADLVDRHRRIVEAATMRERLSSAANGLAQQLGEPVEAGPVNVHWAQGQRMETATDPTRAYLSRVTLPTNRERIFYAAGRTAADTAEEIGALAKRLTPVPKYAHQA